MTVMNHDPLADLEAQTHTDPPEIPANPEPGVQTDAPANPPVEPEVLPTPPDTSSGDDETVLELGETLTIQDVEAAWCQWRSRLDQRGMPLALDPGHLQEIDGAGLQLLCMLSTHRPLRWTGPCRPLQDAARLFGVSAALALDSEVPA